MYSSVLIANQMAGCGRVQKWLVPIRAWAERSFGLCAIQLTQAPGHARQLAQEALARGCRWIIAAGGDGTLSEVAWGFFNAAGENISNQACFVPLPMGTGNDFARSVGLRQLSPSVGPPWNTSKVQSIDVGYVKFNDGTSRTFLNTASLGISTAVNAEMARQAVRGGLGGSLAYLIATLRAWRRFKPPQIRVHMHGQTLEQRMTLLALSNGRAFGGGMRIAPHAALDDGLLDVVIVDPMSTLNLLRNMPALYRGLHLNRPMVHIQRARQVRLEAIEPHQIAIELDGEVCGFLPLDVHVMPRALRVLAPF